MYALAPSRRRRTRPRSVQTNVNTHVSKILSRFPPTPRTPHEWGRKDSGQASPREGEGLDFGSPVRGQQHEHHSPRGDEHRPQLSPMSTEELEEERRTLEGLRSPRPNHPSPAVNAFDVRRREARRGHEEEPGPMSREEAEEERRLLGRVQKRRKQERGPETRRERKVRYRRERGREGISEEHGEDAEDWRAAIDEEYASSPGEGESTGAEEHTGRSKRRARPKSVSAQIKWISGRMSSDKNRPQRWRSTRQTGKGERKIDDPRSRYLKSVQEEDEPEHERGGGREGRDGGSLIESSPEESSAVEGEHRPLKHNHHHEGQSVPSRILSKRHKDRGRDEEKYGPAQLLRRPDQAKELKGWSWTAVQHDGRKQWVVVGFIALVVAVLALAGWAIWYFGTQYGK